ncbi:MAG: DNA-formamidopyrimidine glycosylase [Candidatus Caccosoma sp.]|nr:DNA-formamidopyrimidine glycosylase [Candidatus Caccosoma sp.]
MPELPEVETIKNALKEDFLNEKISNVVVNYENILENVDKETFINSLRDQTIKSFNRLGKYIIVYLTNYTLIIHLRMEGKFKLSESLIDKHSHIIFYFYSKKILIYHDVRKFGRMWLFNNNVDIFKEKPLCNLGLELSMINDPAYLYNKFKKNNKPIKTCLLDQSIIAGIGNIYADEICFACKINPLTKANKLTIDDCKNIIKEGNIILNEAIKEGGSSIKTFKNTHGVDGMFQQKLKVYGRENKPCLICHSIIVKEFVNGRGTHYCPNCQKEKL